MAEVRRKKQDQPVQKLLVLTAGIQGILFMVTSIPGVSDSGSMVFIGSFVLCLLLWLLFFYRRRWFWPAVAVFCAGVGGLCFFFQTLLAAQFSILLTSLRGGVGQAEAEVESAILLIGALVTVFLFLMEIVLEYHLLPYVLVTGMMLGGPFLGIRIGVGTAALCLLFQILFWTLYTARERDEILELKEEKRKALAAKCGRTMGGFLAAVLVCAVLLVSLFGPQFYRAAYQGEGFLSRTFQQISGRADDVSANGHVSRGNNYPAGEAQMTLFLSEQPTETLYLKGFTGGEYTGGDWEMADDEEIFHEVAERLNWGDWESWVGGLFYTLYFAMNSMTAEEGEEPPEVLYVEHEGGDYRRVYYPYCSSWIGGWDAQMPGYGYSFYERGDMGIDWQNIPEDFEQQGEWYWLVQNGYLREMRDVYTQADEAMLPRLARLCEEHPFASLDQISAFILSTLQSQTEYTRTPGRAPLNEDIVEYFLFERQEGYCVHFASAATLMYRFYGIPARYASGYAVQPSDFEMGENGYWTAEVTDKSAHAWTEIFMEDYGWMPVEVTPADDGSMNTSYPGFDMEEFSILQEGLDLSARSDLLSAKETEQRDEKTREATASALFVDLDFLPEILPAATGVILVAAPLSFLLRRRWRLGRMKRKSSREIFAKWLHMLYFCGFSKEYIGVEEEFPRKAADFLQNIGEEEAARLREIISRAAYGPEKPDEEEEHFVKDIYLRSAAVLEQRLPRRKRLSFRYWHCYG